MSLRTVGLVIAFIGVALIGAAYGFLHGNLIAIIAGTMIAFIGLVTAFVSD